MDRLVDVCPNIQTLHLGYSNRTAIDPWTSPKRDYFMKIARFNRLNTLSFNAFHLFDGSFFSAVSGKYVYDFAPVYLFLF